MSTFKSSWGYHSVDYKDFLILKEMHKMYWESLKEAYQWMRWQRKHPRNRRGEEPKVNDLFIDTAKSSYFFTADEDGNSRCHNLPFTCKFDTIVADFQDARMPVKEECDIKELDMAKYLELYREITSVR